MLQRITQQHLNVASEVAHQVSEKMHLTLVFVVLALVFLAVVDRRGE